MKKRQTIFLIVIIVAMAIIGYFYSSPNELQASPGIKNPSQLVGVEKTAEIKDKKIKAEPALAEISEQQELKNLIMSKLEASGLEPERTVRRASTDTFRKDSNCDGALDFTDINPFVLALTSQAAWTDAYTCDYLLANDYNSDGAINFEDINPFVLLLTGGCVEDLDCDEGEACIDEECVVQGCVDDYDCSEGEFCIDEECVNQCPPNWQYFSQIDKCVFNGYGMNKTFWEAVTFCIAISGGAGWLPEASELEPICDDFNLRPGEVCEGYPGSYYDCAGFVRVDEHKLWHDTGFHFIHPVCDEVVYDSCGTQAVNASNCQWQELSIPDGNKDYGFVCLKESVQSVFVASKDPVLYSEKEVFLISDSNWHNVLPLVPVTTWTGDENWCQRGYGTPENVCVYPTLIYHQEGEAFDADSIIYFLQQYSPTKLKVIGDIPQDLANLLNASQPFGAGLSEDQIQSIGVEDYPYYWSFSPDIVYVEDNYELALLASTYASLINAPLVIQGHNEIDFSDKNVICVGSGLQNCNEQYNLEQLQQKYIDETNTDKIILVNPNDL
ncbi:MAG: hypothetical protein KJ600_06310 [Nanoarchaeota archaeon]|nr:hypothetical protein [Nanoarchaeota archaeon]MBU1104138.1 hypothetical protein [Nanoarchaeota archaeon]